MFSCASGGTEVFTANVTVLRLDVRSHYHAAFGTRVALQRQHHSGTGGRRARIDAPARQC
jgi:hypothetical protein